MSLLFVSGSCVRALLAEKLMLQHMALSGLMDQQSSSSPSKAGPAQRLLVLSAGLDNAPGAPVGRAMMAAAAEAGIDLTEDNPCARLDRCLVCLTLFARLDPRP